MNILQILPELNVGGVETGTLDLAKYLVNHGHKSVVVSNGGKLVSQLVESGSKHYSLPVNKKSLWTIVAMIKPLREIILKEQIDIVHARSRVPAWIAYFACYRTNAQLMTTCHGFYNNKFFSQVMGWGKRVIVPSEAIGKHMINDFKVDPGHVRLIPRSVDLEKFSLQKEYTWGQSKFIVAIVGRITPLKGHIYFIQAMARVIRQMPYVKGWIIGDAPANKDTYKKELLMIVKHLGLTDHIEFLGNRSDIPQLLSKVDVVVLSTITQEAFGRVILEAQAVGVPVVATNVGGVIDIIDNGKTGLLVMPKDTQAMAEALMRLLKNRELSLSIVKEAKKKLESKFTLEHMASKTLAVYEEVQKSMNILIIKLSAVGDVILSTAAFKALRQKFPESKIYCLTSKECRKVLKHCPSIDEYLIYDPAIHKNFINLLKLAKHLHEHQFDKVIDLQNNRLSHLLSFLIFPKESYGYNLGKWGFLLSKSIKEKNEHLSAIEHQFQILKLLDIPYLNEASLELWPSEVDEKYIETLLESEWLAKSKNIVGVNLAASSKWKSKNWPLNHIAKLCDLLAAKNIRVILTGMRKDLPLASEVISLTKSKPALLAGKTEILQLAALIKRCKVFITCDSAPLHIAAAMRTPVVALFGPTDSLRHKPPFSKMVVIEKKPPCAPCYAPVCPIGVHPCMKEITPEEVLKAVDSLMDKEHEYSSSHNAS